MNSEPLPTRPIPAPPARRGAALLALLLAIALPGVPARAGLHVWSGAVNGNWSTAGNWSSGGAPAAGEANVILRFPSGATRYLSTNNIAGLTIQSIHLNGNAHHLYGNGVTLAVTERGGTNIVLAPGGIGGFIHLPLTLPAGLITVHAQANTTLEILSPISGTGPLINNGDGLLRLNGTLPNSFTGGFQQYAGTTALGKTFGPALPGPVTIGLPTSTDDILLTYEANHQIADAADVHVHGGKTLLSLEGFADTINNLDMVGGVVQTYQSGFGNNQGELRLNGDVTVDDAHTPNAEEPEIVGKLNLGNVPHEFIIPVTQRLIMMAHVASTGTNGGILLATGGNLGLYRSNSFSGPLHIQAGQAYAYDSSAFGSAAGPTILDGGSLFIGYSTHVAAEPLEVRESSYLTAAATNSWNGPIHIATNETLNVWSSTFGGEEWLKLGGPISGPGRMSFIIDHVELAGANPNTLAGGFVIRGHTSLVLGKSTSNALSGPVEFDYAFSDTAYPSVKWAGPHQIADNSRLTCNNFPAQNALAGILNLANHSEVIGSILCGPMMSIQCGSGRLTIGADHQESAYWGGIFGAPGGTNLHKIGAGTLFLGGNHSLLGKLLVSTGRLTVTNATGVSAIQVLAGATLAGHGSCGAVTINSGAYLSPGATTASTSYGRLTTGSLSTPGSYWSVGLGGTTPGVSHDQIAVSTSLNLSGTTLLLSTLPLPHGSNSFVIASLASGTVTGTFTGLPEGSLLQSSDAKWFRISYQGGDGNDVVLTRHYTMPPGGRFTGINPLPDGRIRVSGSGLTDATYRVEATTNLSSPEWVHVGTVTASDEFGTLEFIDAEASLHPMRFYRFMTQ